MPKINIKVTLKGQDDTLTTEAEGTVTKNTIKYKEKDGTKMSFNYSKNKLIRETKDLRMTFDFEEEVLLIEYIELNVHMDLELELIRLERDNYNVEVEYVLDNKHEKEKLIYRIEELK